MDRNSAIGLALITLLLLGYFYWFAPTPTATPQKPTAIDAQKDSIDNVPSVAQNDSSLVATYGDLSSAVKGIQSTTQVETEDLKITFSNKGGIIKELELKKYKTYSQQPLKLITPSSNEFTLRTNYRGSDIDLYTLFYKVDQRKIEDTTEVTYSITLEGGAKISHAYKIPSRGYEIVYRLNTTGFDKLFSGEHLTFHWTNILKPMEKDLVETRNHSTITYYSDADGFGELDQRSADEETEVFAAPVKWVTIKEKFFLSSIIAKNTFSGGKVQTSVNESDSTVVKRATVKLFIPAKALGQGNADFKLYFGPNDYQQIGNVAENFSKNVYLGLPPFYWINKFVIFPVFHFLTQFISNHGLIIIILVILLKLVLFPLSYTSYLSMAKMKVLKPELEEIKKRVGEDMAKVQQEQMKLYAQVGVSPLSGCIPVLLQMPVLFAMFYLFPASIELRQQPFLWAEDLSTYDSIISLPFVAPFLGSHLSLFTLLMTTSNLVYIWQNNLISAVQGPMKTMSYIMPVILLFAFNRFSAGLTFYYFISNLVTLIQQAIIRRFVNEGKIKAVMEENKKTNAANGGVKKSKFMSKLEEAMKASQEARNRAEEERKKNKS